MVVGYINKKGILMKTFLVISDLVFRHNESKNLIQKTVKRNFLAEDGKSACRLMEAIMPGVKMDAEFKGFALMNASIIGAFPSGFLN